MLLGRLFWDDDPSFCQRCGGKLWKITEGSGVPIIPFGDESKLPNNFSKDTQTFASGAVFQVGEEADDFVKTVAEADALEARCARVWDASLRQRREYRHLRRIDLNLARESQEDAAAALTALDANLVEDVDRFLDKLCAMYLGGDSASRAEIRSVMESNKRLLGNLHN